METADLNLVTPAREFVFRSARYKYICERFISWCADQELSLNLGNEILWLESLKDEGKSAATIRLYAYAVKAYLLDNFDDSGMSSDESAFAKYRIESGFRAFRMPKAINRKVKERVLSDDELKMVLSKSRMKTRILIEFMATTGCRVSEMINIRKSHVKKVREGEYRIRIMGKGSKERFLTIPGGMRKRIYKVFPDTDRFLFESSTSTRYSPQTIHLMVQRSGDRVGIKGLHPHSLRHYFATHMINKTGDIDAVSEYLGHSDVSTTLSMYYHGKRLTLEQLTFDLYGNRGKNKGVKSNAKKSKKNL